MNAKIEAAPMEAVVETTTVSVTAQKVTTFKAISLIERVASSSRSVLSIAGTSISAVAPDYINFDWRLAEAA